VLMGGGKRSHARRALRPQYWPLVERPLAIISALREGARKASLASNDLLIWAIIFEGAYGSGSSWRALKRGHHLMAVLAETP